VSPEEIVPGAGGSDSCSADVAAYALGALEPDEAEAFARHLETCAVCPVELVAFQQVVDDLAISAPSADAPRTMKRRLMAAVAAEPRLDRSARTERRRLRDRIGLSPGLAVAGGLALAAIIALVVVLALPGASTRSRTIAAQVTGRGTASLRVSGGHAELVLHHFAAPPRGKIYEVWVQRGSANPSPTAALFSVNRGGDGDVDVPGSLHGVTHVLVTPEPAGGSRVPTHAPVITATL
jgi:hypothetical protein